MKLLNMNYVLPLGSNVEPKPNCNENRKDLITRLKRNGVYKAVDLGGINSAKQLKYFKVGKFK